MVTDTLAYYTGLESDSPWLKQITELLPSDELADMFPTSQLQGATGTTTQTDAAEVSSCPSFSSHTQC